LQRLLYRWISGACVGAACLFLSVSPAVAAGPLTQLAVAERCFGQLVSSQPWMAPHRDAFYWGSLAVAWNTASGSPHRGPEKPPGGESFLTLWRKAQTAGNLARAFGLGWLVHLTTEQVQIQWQADHERTQQLAQMIALPSDAGNLALAADLALDAALLPGAGATLRTMASVARAHAGTPAGGTIQKLMRDSLGVEEQAYLNWAGFVFLAGARGPDAYLALRARQAHLEALAPVLTGTPGRVWAQGHREFLTLAAETGIREVLAQLKKDAQAPSARSAPRAATAARTVRATLMRP